MGEKAREKNTLINHLSNLNSKRSTEVHSSIDGNVNIPNYTSNLNINLNPIWGIWGSTFYLRGRWQKCPTLVFSKLEMVWQWNLASIEAILCQVKINCEISKRWIIFDDVSTTLRNTVKLTIFWHILLTGVIQSSSDTYFQKRWFLLASTTWKWQKVRNYWTKRKKNFRGFFSIWRHPRKGVVQTFVNLFSTIF